MLDLTPQTHILNGFSYFASSLLGCMISTQCSVGRKPSLQRSFEIFNIYLHYVNSNNNSEAFSYSFRHSECIYYELDN